MFSVIYIPDFSLQSVLRDEPDLFLRPVALINGVEKNATIFQLTRPAREAGVCEGLTPTQAMARCGTVLIKSRSAPHEKTTTQILLQTAYAFSPRIEATADGICTMDLQGLGIALPASCRQKDLADSAGRMPAAHWAEKIFAVLKSLNLHAQIGIAETPNLALHAARCANPLLLVENSTDFISALPVESLEPTPQIFDILRRWGIRTAGEFTALGKDKIAERLGTEALELFDRASAVETRPLNLVTPAEHFSEAMELESEIESLQPLLFILRRFLEQLSRRIDALHLVVSDLRLHLKLSSGDIYESLFKVPSPTANVDILFSMLQTHLESVRTDSTIIAIELSARPARGENFQFGLFEASLRDPNQFAETLARLNALCGDGKVGSAVMENTFRPDAFRMGSPQFDAASANQQQSTDKLSAALCLRRFRPPIHADVEVKSGHPSFIASLKVSSPIKSISGPFRTSGDWWEQARLWQRDEWDIETADGTMYRIYHANDDWFIEGIYD
ncbi:MAG: DNA polymerase Y family protein [Verrucomicrobia bacterium]|nr:DNA polymerase Y family protein [Verrucomicrobiota bacterium]